MVGRIVAGVDGSPPSMAAVEWGKPTEEDRRALSPLFWAHVNSHGRFRLDMGTRLDLTAA
ncbi:hypothetical protein ACWEJ6_31700 [Nonomuraea sp. NPDC004702]